jgi:hypothetical protein
VLIVDWSREPWAMACEARDYQPGQLHKFWPAAMEPVGECTSQALIAITKAGAWKPQRVRQCAPRAPYTRWECMNRRGFLLNPALGVTPGLTLTRSQATIPEHSWGRCDWPSGPEVKGSVVSKSVPAIHAGCRDSRQRRHHGHDSLNGHRPESRAWGLWCMSQATQGRRDLLLSVFKLTHSADVLRRKRQTECKF